MKLKTEEELNSKPPLVLFGYYNGRSHSKAASQSSPCYQVAEIPTRKEKKLTRVVGLGCSATHSKDRKELKEQEIRWINSARKAK